MNRNPNGLHAALLAVAVLTLASLAACGGGGSGSPMTPPSAAGPTTLRGNLARMAAHNDHVPLQRSSLARVLALVSTADAQESGVQVCIESSTFCSATDANGTFVLVAPVDGDLALLFTGADFSARLVLTGIPMGAIVTLRNIECSTSSGRCAPQQLDIEAPAPTGAPLEDQPPVCTTASASPPVLAFPPNHEMVAIAIVGVSDPDGDAVTSAPTSILQDEPVLGPGSGDTTPDAMLVPLAVRAERSGQGNGRVYTVRFVASDGRGGSCIGSVHVCAPHDQRPGATCIDDGPVFDSLS